MQEAHENEISVEDAEACRYRRAVGRLLWILPARPDLCFVVKELSRKKSKPTKKDVQAMKRCLKYVKGSLKTIFIIMQKVEESEKGKIQAWTDANWAAPKSTTGCVIKLGGMIMLTAARTQAATALSSAEAEIVAANETGKETVYLLHLQQQLEPGNESAITLCCDASAAVAFGNRKGLGRVRHLQLRQLWIQEQIEAKVMTMRKVA